MGSGGDPPRGLRQAQPTDNGSAHGRERLSPTERLEDPHNDRTMTSTQDHDAAALARAAEALGLRLVLRFGSRATESAMPVEPESDLDIAVLAGDRWVSLMEVYTALQPAFPGVELDVVLLNEADPLFRHEVLRQSDLLFGDPDVYAEYDAYAYRDFMDSADLREIEDVLSRRKLQRLLDAAGWVCAAEGPAHHG